MPYRFESLGGPLVTRGCFCSFECMKRFNLESKNMVESSRICGLIMLHKLRLCGDSRRITAAPSRYCLKKFGGNLTIEEYRKNDNNYELRFDDSRHTNHTSVSAQLSFDTPIADAEMSEDLGEMRERDEQSRMKLAIEKLGDVDMATKPSASLKLRRPVERKRETSSIVGLLGLVKK